MVSIHARAGTAMASPESGKASSGVMAAVLGEMLGERGIRRAGRQIPRVMRQLFLS